MRWRAMGVDLFAAGTFCGVTALAFALIEDELYICIFVYRRVSTISTSREEIEK